MTEQIDPADSESNWVSPQLEANPYRIDLREPHSTHVKAYIPKSMDRVIKLVQARMIEETQLNITYSETLRRLLIAGIMNLADELGMDRVELIFQVEEEVSKTGWVLSNFKSVIVEVPAPIRKERNDE